MRPYYTPLRYPGGKRRLLFAMRGLLEENNLKDIDYVEPYAGGAGLAIALLVEEYATRIHLNDLSRAVYAFWHSVLNETKEFCSRVEHTEVTIQEWRKQREIFRNQSTQDLFDLGFAAFFLNRTNRSGIMAGGVIGGQSQKGVWTLDVRFNKEELIQRIQKIGRYRDRIDLYNMDALQFSKKFSGSMKNNTLCFFDPPYIENGEDLYLNNYDIEDHKDLAKFIRSMETPWIVTYDDPAIKYGLYAGSRRIAYDLKYTAQGRRKGREVMFFSYNLKAPAIKNFFNWRISPVRRLSIL